MLNAPPEARAAIAALCRQDPDLARIEAQAGPLAWRTRPIGFVGLLQAIVGQQISNQAAAAIWRRLAALEGATTPAGLMGLDDEALRAPGLSRPKILHARALAAAYLEGRLDDGALARMDDETAVATIASIRGMGRWSAEVYLLFALLRPNVFPAADLALASAAAHLKQLDARPSAKALRALADGWRPYRGFAARLLWHHWRYLTNRPSFDDAV
jgi:DNA-3-methyladenine glycosylase II